MNKDDSQFAPRGESPAIPASQKIDQAIDRAVRRMMHVDPPPGLRRRVMTRIEAPPRRAFFLPGYAVAAAALAVLVLAVVVTRDRRVAPPPVAAPSAVVAVQTPPAVTPVVRAPDSDAPAAPAPPKGTGRRTGFHSDPIPMPRVEDIFGARTSAVTAAADPTADAVWTAPPPAGVESSSAGPAPLVLPPISLIPIETHPIVIVPLLSGRLPNGATSPPR
jgi:hypothetical protein